MVDPRGWNKFGRRDRVRARSLRARDPRRKASRDPPPMVDH